MAGLRVENDTLSNMKWILSILLGFAPAFAVDAPAPSVFTMPTQFQRVVIVRLKHQTDILEGLKEAVVREKIKNAVILSGFGSVISYHIHVVNNTTFPRRTFSLRRRGHSTSSQLAVW
jgi:ABC-type maltose transport system permease subunit